MKRAVCLFFSLMLLLDSLRAVDLYSREDAWEHHHLISVYASSTWTDGTTGNNFDPRDIFGGFFSTQEAGFGHFAFADSLGMTTLVTNIVEFEVSRKVPLIGYSVALGADAGIIRMSSLITLKAFNPVNGTWKQLDQYVPLYISVANPNHYGPVSETNRPLPSMEVAKRFMIEVVNHVDNLGPRVIEIDAVTAPNLNPTILNVSSPADDSSYELPAEIPISYSASDEDGIETVEVRANNSLIYSGAATGSLIWTNNTAGRFTIEFKVIDNLGEETPRTVTGTVIDNRESTVRLANPQFTETYYTFDVTGFTVGNGLSVFGSSDFENWEELAVEYPSEETWIFSIPRGSESLRFFRVMETYF